MELISEPEQQQPKKKYCQSQYNEAIKYYRNNTEKCKEYFKLKYHERKQDEEWKKKYNEQNRDRMR
jgi:hypothetical protein